MKLIRYTSVLTAFLMLATAVQPVPAAAVPFAGAAAVSAAEEEPVAADTIGETIRWQLDADGVLTVTGSGDMADVNGNAFGSNAAKIKSAVIRNTDSKHVITAIGSGMFRGCTALESVTLPETVVSIGEDAFYGCTALTAFSFPKSLKEIGKNGFHSSGLTAAELPGCALGWGAFYACAGLKTVTIGEGTETIPAECFRKCAALESVTLPDSVKEINCGGFTEQGAFSECPELKTVSIGKGIESIHQNAFRTTGEELEVVFRKGTVAIPDHAFDNAPVTKIILPRSVEEISADAVSGCASLKEILIQAPECVIADSAKAIPADAVIRSYEGSTPQTHAEKYEYKFVKLLLPGDLNDDGAVSADDAQMTLKAYTERIAGNDMKLTEDQVLAADVDEDGALSVEDAQFILKYYTAKTVAQKDITWDDILNPSAKQS